MGSNIRNILPRILTLILALGIVVAGTTSALAVTTSSLSKSGNTGMSANQEAGYRKTAKGNIYVGGKDITVDESVSGDLLVAGGEIKVQKQVNGHVVAAGAAIQIDGVVQEDLLVTGGVVIVNGTVTGDVRVFAGEVYINSENIGGDLFTYAGEIHVSDKTKVAGDSVTNESSSEKEGVFLNEPNNPTSLNDARIKSSYYNFTNERFDGERYAAADTFFKTIGFVFGTIWTLGSIIAAFVIIRLFPVFFNMTAKRMSEDGLNTTIIGFITIVASWLVGLFLLVSIIGIPLLFALILLSSLASMLATVYSRYMVGKLVLGRLFNVENPSQFANLVVGYLLIALILYLLKFIPVLGHFAAGMISTVLVSWALGAIVLNKREDMMGKQS